MDDGNLNKDTQKIINEVKACLKKDSNKEWTNEQLAEYGIYVEE